MNREANTGDLGIWRSPPSWLRRAALLIGRFPKPAALLALGLLVVGSFSGPAAAQTPTPKIPNEVCLGCHSIPNFSVTDAAGKTKQLFVDPDKFSHSIHGSRHCQDCHTNITEVPHQPIEIKVDCVSCHENSLASALQSHNEKQAKNLDFVVTQIHKFMSSIHAQPSRADQSRTNATCYNCHQPHYVYAPGTPVWKQWRMNLPYTCGACHTKELADYKTSIHGVEVLKLHNPKAAICADCHTSHDIANPVLTSTKLVITKNCGSCHKERLDTYLATYHGQVSTLGYGYTAKCFDCHDFHKIQRESDPRSTINPANRLHTCQKCHANATEGFVTFEPHGNAHDYKNYPLLWLAAKAMSLLLLGVFAFFWTHSALWFYRSYKERKARGEPVEFFLYRSPDKNETYFQRFAPIWRIAHLLVLLATMTLVLTGMTVLYSDSAWAPVVVRWFGGPEAMAIVHRVCATIFLSTFLGHVIYMTVKLHREGRSFRWFGPDSLIVRWQDFYDIQAMFRWFFGLGPRPEFDRWTYWEKFDYWAVFWGVMIIGGSGAILWFKAFVLQFLPGWVLNVALIVHGDEALLAAVFLFTVHFFNNHFRPDKFPLDTTMFTGVITEEEFKREHPAEYERLAASGELESRRVPPPSPTVAFWSRVLGFTLLAIGLMLLLLVAIGFFGHTA